MAQSRKRKRIGQNTDITKKAKTSSCPDTSVKRDLLDQCYPLVRTLRQHLLVKLPGSSRLRRKKLANIGQEGNCRDLEKNLSRLLDTTLVCTSEQGGDEEEDKETRWQQWLSFSQKGDDSHVTISGSPESSIYSQSEIIDFVIWLLFTREKSGPWPKHLLCDGFRKGAGDGDNSGTSIPGVFCRFPNSHVKTLKQSPWPQLLALLGKSGERVMIDLLVDCSLFLAVDVGFGNYYQLSGIPLSELDISRSGSGDTRSADALCRKPSEITLVRSRIFYAKPTLTARGIVQAGFKHIHVLNRCLNSPISDTLTDDQVKELRQRNQVNTTKVMMYIFPRQFKMHNVFTSVVDRSQTAQKFQDYTLRESEIASVSQGNPQKLVLPKIPKRLRGNVWGLVQRLQIRHRRCSYLELLKHYCPSTMDPKGVAGPQDAKSSAERNTSQTNPAMFKKTAPSQYRHQPKGISRNGPSRTQPLQPPNFDSVLDLACPVAHVSSFCTATLSKLIPDGFWGGGDTMVHNKKLMLRKVDHFIKLRRFETMSLHEIVQGFKVVDIPWLQPPKLQDQKTSQTDLGKRFEIFHEFLYYVFDSLLLPLIRSNFYVTESNTHRYQVFYYRHDIWKRVAEPAMAALKERMFEEVKCVDALRILDSRALGFSQIRLLPKGRDLRPITNLRRRTVARGSSKTLAPSINTVLGPVHTFLKLEKTLDPSRLGATMFSVNGLYTKLKDFKVELSPDHGQLFFAKLDVQAAFDTIPQEAIVRLMASVPAQPEYTISKHAEVKPGERAILEAIKPATRPIRRWHATAVGQAESTEFRDRLEKNLGSKKKNTVFVDSAVRKTHTATSLLDLLVQHVTQNLVKIGKKYYRQKTGIPQGSVLSSFLCNYFYADLEIHHLGFLNGPDSLLLRLIDDFLLITLDKKKAIQFVETMHQGLPEYGVKVNPQKTLVNFDMTMPEGPVSRISKGESFPYCGTLIDCHTLEVTKDRQRGKDIDVSHSLTVEFGRSPGQNFERKVLNAFKIQSHLMFFDTTHNSTGMVLKTLYGAFYETATKMWAYIRCLPGSKRPRSGLVIRAIIKVIDVAFLLLTGKSRKMRYEGYACDVRKAQVAKTAYQAFLEVLGRKQAGYREAMDWLDKEVVRLEQNK